MGYFIHFLALAVNCKLQKYLFKKRRHSGNERSLGWKGRALRLAFYRARKKKFDNILTTAVPFFF